MSDILFSASTTHLTHIATVLQAIAQVSGKSIVDISQEGVRFMVGHSSRISRGSVLLTTKLFGSYNYNAPTVGDNETDGTSERGNGETEDNSNDSGFGARFQLDLKDLTESLSIMMTSSMWNAPNSYQKSNGSTGETESGAREERQARNQNSDEGMMCRLTYKGSGSPFIITFENNVMEERCELATYVDDPSMIPDIDLDFDSVVFEAIVHGGIMWEAMRDFEEMKTQTISIYASEGVRNGASTVAENCYFAMVSRAEIGSLRLVFPDVKSVLELLRINKSNQRQLSMNLEYEEDVFGESRIQDNAEEEDQTEQKLVSSYIFDNFDCITRAVKLATKVRIRQDTGGVLSVQLLCPTVIRPSSAGNKTAQNSSYTSKLDDNEKPQQSFIEFSFLPLAESEPNPSATASGRDNQMLDDSENLAEAAQERSETENEESQSDDEPRLFI